MEENLRAVSDRVEALVEELGRCGDPQVRARAQEMVRLLMQLYGAGLTRVLELASAEGSDPRPLAERLADDPLVASLMLLHGLHPADTETRVRQALQRVGPDLASHGVGASLLSLADGVLRLRLEGSVNGCGSSREAVKLLLERAVEEAAPEVEHVQVEGLATDAPIPLIRIQARNGAAPAVRADP